MLISDDIQFVLNTQSYFTIAPYSEIDIGNPFSSFFDDLSIVMTGIVRFNCSSSLNGLTLTFYHKDLDNGLTEIDKSKTINNVLSFNMSKFLYLEKDNPGTFVIENNSPFNVVIQKSGHYFDYEYQDKMMLYKTKNVISGELTDLTTYSFDYSLNQFILNRTLLKNLLKLDISLSYNSEMKDETFLFFPKGWKPKFLDYLIIERDSVTNEILNVDYVDKNNVRHYLDFADCDDLILYAFDGSGIALKQLFDENTQIETFELISDLSTDTKVFNSNGLLISACDINGNSVSISYSPTSIIVTDNASNTITIQKDTNNNQITIGIQHTNLTPQFLEPSYLVSENPITNVLGMNSNNQLVSITMSGLTDYLSYDSDGLLIQYNSYKNKVLDIQASDNRINLIREKQSNIITTKYSIDYDYLRFVITNRFGVKTFINIDKNLNQTSSGETIGNNNDTPSVYCENKMLVKDILSEVNINKGRTFLFNNSNEKTITSDGSYLSNSSVETNSNDAIEIKAGHRYLLVATMEKTNNYPLGENKSIQIDLRDGDQAIIETLYFNPIYKKQTAFLEFSPVDDESSSFIYDVGISCSGTAIIGSYIVSDVSIIELKGKRTTYYASHITGVSYSQGFSSNQISINGITWHEFSSASDSSGREYSFSDLVRNYINTERDSHMFWSEDGRELIYNENSSYSPSGGYIFRTHHNLPSSNMMFAKKTWIKDYEVNGLKKEIFEFSYIQKNNDGNFEYITIKNIGDVSKTSKKIFDNIFNLLEEIDSNDVKTAYQYKTINNDITHLVEEKTVSLDNSNSTESFLTEYTYDSRNRLKSEAYTIPGQASTKSYYYAASSDLKFASTDEESRLEQFLFDQNLQFVKKISNSNFIHQMQHTGNTIYQYMIGSGTFDTLYQVINATDEVSSTFQIKITANSSVIDYLKTKYFYANNELMVRKTYYSGKRYDDYYDSYGRLYGTDYYESQNINYSLCALYYFDVRPTNLESISTESAMESAINSYGYTSRMNAKLYKVFDYVSNQVINYDYYSNNKLKTILTKSSSGVTELTIDYSYDFLDRLIKTEYSIGNSNPYNFKREVTYDNNFEDKIVEVKYTIGNRHFTQVITYDDFSRITSIENGGVNLVSFDYSPVQDNQTPIYILDPVVQPLTHSSAYMNKSGQYYLFNNSAPGFVSYDKTGNITAISYGLIYQLNSNNADRYTYDSNDRISKEKNKKLNKTLVYNYDSYGNITSIVTKSFDETSTLQTETFEYDSAFKNKLITFNNNNVNYDNDFNVTNFGSGLTFAWSRGRLLSSVSYGVNQTMTFGYNKDGVRVSKNDPNTGLHKYHLEGNRIIAEDITKNNTTKRLIYLYGIDGVCGIFDGDDFYYFVKNQLGDVIEIRYAQAVYAKYIYDAFGNCTVTDSNGNEITDPDDIAHINPFRYRGYYYDRETNLYYCINRYYSPELRRWMSMDDTKYFDSNSLGGMNLYCYCLNNPIRYIDPFGISELPGWAYWVIGVGALLLLFTLTVVTAGIADVALGTALMAGLTGSVVGSGVAGTVASITSAAFIGSSIGAFIGTVSGGFQLNKNGSIGWSWDEAGKGFLSGILGGGATGTVGFGINYAFSKLNYSVLMKSFALFAGCGITSVAINKFRVISFDQKNNDLENVVAFFTEGSLNALPLSGGWIIVASIVIGLMEGLIEDIYGYFTK